MEEQIVSGNQFQLSRDLTRTVAVCTQMATFFLNGISSFTLTILGASNGGNINKTVPATAHEKPGSGLREETKSFYEPGKNHQ